MVLAAAIGTITLFRPWFFTILPISQLSLVIIGDILPVVHTFKIQ
jgi:hypothetical protein